MEPRWKAGKGRGINEPLAQQGQTSTVPGEGVLTYGEKGEPDLGWEESGSPGEGVHTGGLMPRWQSQRDPRAPSCRAGAEGTHASPSLPSMSLMEILQVGGITPAPLCRGATAVQSLSQMAELVQGRVGIRTHIC